MKSIKQLARESALSDGCIRSRLEKGWTLDEAIKPKGYKRAEDVAERVKQCDDMLEYLGGYESKTSIIKLRCLRCGNEFERRYDRLLQKKSEGKCGCPSCQTKEGRAKQRFLSPNAEHARARLKEKGFELLEYSGADNKVKVKCLECGETFVHNSYHNLMTLNKSKRFCPVCNERDRIIAKANKEQARIIKARKEQSEATFNRLKKRLKRNVVVKHVCRNCGETFWGTQKQKYCSRRCADRCNEKERQVRKDARINSRKKDSGITLEKVYRKANGFCYLCGCKTDLDDYIIKDGTFIAGNKYPSIEHIKPIAKGGTHTWNNVALACRICNSRKSDKTIHQFTLPV